MRRHRNIANLTKALGSASKRLHFVGSSQKDLRALPELVRRIFGRALLDVQYGGTPQAARAFGEGVGGVMKLIEDHDGQTFRAAYTIEFERAVYVLHVFEKKAKHGIATPRRDIALVRARLRQARDAYHAQYQQREG